MSHPYRHPLILGAALTLILAVSAAAHPPALRWEKMHVLHLLPTAVFARLGLTHSTKNGHTLDGKRNVPDPDFPPGLTDVVPNDAERLLLVRGTTGGLSLFRSRVTAADVQLPILHLIAELTRAGDAAGTPPLTQETDNVQDGIPITVSLSESDTARVYQIKAHANADGSLWIACRVSLPLPPPPAAAATGSSAPAAVFVPDRVWADPVSRKVRPGEIATFEDRAADRQAASRKMGATGTDTNDDYTLRVTLTPMEAPIALPPMDTPAPAARP